MGTTPFCCPVCGAPLHEGDGALVCAAHHSFDVAHGGYVHLLPADKKRTKLPGDSPDMVAARRRFLASGAYAPFANALCEIVRTELEGKTSPLVVDAGCGEGYYTHRLHEAVPTARMAALDISKSAVKAAARRGDGIAWAVASSFALPLPAACADVLSDVFSPVAAQEFARVVRPGGLFVLAVPGPRHLFGLKSVLYDTPYENAVQDVAYAGFSCEERVPVRDGITVPKEQTQDLFAMTPYFWKTPREGAERLTQSGAITTEIAFDFVLYRRAAQ